MSYLDTVTAKRDGLRQEQTETQANADLVGELRAIRQAVDTTRQAQAELNNRLSNETLSANQQLADSVRQLQAAMEAMHSTLQTHENTDLSEVTHLLKQVVDVTAALPKEPPVVNVPETVIPDEVTIANPVDHRQEFQQLLAAITSLKLTAEAPIVNLPEPVVHVDAPVVELPEPVQAPPDRFDLSRYKAQDLKDGDTVQYIGFVNPEGAWYIIENDVKQNRMRYLFGQGGYAKVFAQAGSYQYKMLDKAINAAA